MNPSASDAGGGGDGLIVAPKQDKLPSAGYTVYGKSNFHMCDSGCPPGTWLCRDETTLDIDFSNANGPRIRGVHVQPRTKFPPTSPTVPIPSAGACSDDDDYDDDDDWPGLTSVAATTTVTTTTTTEPFGLRVKLPPASAPVVVPVTTDTRAHFTRVSYGRDANKKEII